MKERQQYHSKQEPAVPIRKCKNNVPAIEIENAVCEQLKNHKPDIHFLRGFADRLNHCRQERKKLYVPELEEKPEEEEEEEEEGDVVYVDKKQVERSAKKKVGVKHRAPVRKLGKTSKNAKARQTRGIIKDSL